MTEQIRTNTQMTIHKLMDELLAEIDNYSTVKGDSKSLGRFATSISVFVSDMENNGCPVQEVSEAPFFMSKLEKRTTRTLEERCSDKRKNKMWQI